MTGAELVAGLEDQRRRLTLAIELVREVFTGAPATVVAELEAAPPKLLGAVDRPARRAKPRGSRVAGRGSRVAAAGSPTTRSSGSGNSRGRP